VIVWRTSRALSAEVRYGRTPENLDQVVRGPEIVARTAPRAGVKGVPPQLHSAPEGTWQYEARLAHLEPEARYYYAIHDGESRLAGGDAQHYFTTHPRAGTAKGMRFWVVGDSGKGSAEQGLVYKAMLAQTARDSRPIDFYLHVGDMAYNSGTDAEFQRHFFEAYAPTLRHVVCWPAMGNHEGVTSWGVSAEGPYYDAFVVPTRGEVGGAASGTEAYYSFEYGRAHFVCLNSHDVDRTANGPMAQWLKADLASTRAEWLIAFFHHPPYTKGSHDSDTEYQMIEMRLEIMPILEAAGVDLVLTGHSHIYERSMLMDGAYGTPTLATNVILDDGDGDPNGDGAYRKSAGLQPNAGTVQIVTGNGGIGLRRKGTMPLMKRIILEHGSVIVDIDGDTLRAVMLNKSGETRDVFSVVKRGQVELKRIANPKPAPAGPPAFIPASNDTKTQ
jgi:acid phosphatase type 7